MAKLPNLSGRRPRVFFFVLILLILVIVYVITAPRATRKSQFYKKTEDALIKARYENDVANAMANAGDPNARQYPQRVQDRSPDGQDRINDAKAQQDSGRGWLEDTLKERLRLAELAAKKSADEKWRDVQDAAEKASKDADRSGQAGQGQNGEAAAQPALGVNAKRDTYDTAVTTENGEQKETTFKAAEVIASQIIEGVKQAAREEVLTEARSEGAAVSSEHESHSTEASPSPTEALQDDESDELLREISAARNRQKERLKAEYKNQLKIQEMERQKVEGAIAVDARWRQPAKPGSNANNAKTPPKPIPPPEPTTPAELEFQKLLALSPVVIFSKSYCPYSKKAKRILTQAFMITPAPYVVELNEHVYGAEIQEFLRERTGRRTVPNIIVAGKSIGGADEIEALWETNQLKPLLKRIAEKRIVGVVENIDIHKTGWKD